MDFFTTARSFRELAEEAARRSTVREADDDQYEVCVDDYVIAHVSDPETGFMYAIDAIDQLENS